MFQIKWNGLVAIDVVVIVIVVEVAPLPQSIIFNIVVIILFFLMNYDNINSFVKDLS